MRPYGQRLSTPPCAAFPGDANSSGVAFGVPFSVEILGLMPGGFQHESVPTVPLANTPDVAVNIRGRVVNASGSVL